MAFILREKLLNRTRMAWRGEPDSAVPDLR